ncbi:unnamed protein product [Closterium sp. NIES-64]|nr:unnamed protein product [Closterium sp. NIES-64]
MWFKHRVQFNLPILPALSRFSPRPFPALSRFPHPSLHCPVSPHIAPRAVPFPAIAPLTVPPSTPHPSPHCSAFHPPSLPSLFRLPPPIPPLTIPPSTPHPSPHCSPFHPPSLPSLSRLPLPITPVNKNPQPDKLMDGVEQLVDEYDIEQVASAPQLSADDVAAGELSLDCNRFLIGRSMINDRVSDHEEGITWLRSAPRLLWVARERRAEADAAERQRRREK